MKERTELIDAVLKYLISEKGKFISIDVLCIQKFDTADNTLIRSIIDDLLELGIVDQAKTFKGSLRINQKGIDFIEKHGTYSSFLKSLETAHKKTTRLNNVNMALAITSILSLIYGAVFTWLTFSKDNQVDQLETKNVQLEATVDSLTKEIEALKAPQIVVPSDSSTVTETVKEKK